MELGNMRQLRICIIVLISLLLLSCKTTETVIDHAEEKAQTISKDSILSIISMMSDDIELKNDLIQKKGSISIRNDTILFNIILKEKSIINKMNKYDSITLYNKEVSRDTVYINNQIESDINKNVKFYKFFIYVFIFMLILIAILIYSILNKRL